MNRNRISKIAITGFITCLMATTSTYATSVPPSSSPDAETTSTEKKITVSEEEVLKQLESAESLVNQEEKDAFEAKWNAMTPQEKHDYLLPIFLDELNSLHTKMKIAERKVNSGIVLEMSFLQLYQSELDHFSNEIFAISNVNSYSYSAYKPLKKAVDELYTLAGLIDLESVGLVSPAIAAENKASGSKLEYSKHNEYYNDFYNQAYEISLMREYKIEVNENLDRMLQEIALAHEANLERYKSDLNTITKCVALYSKGQTNATLYRDAKNVTRDLYVDFNIRDTSDFSTVTINEHDELTPLAYTVVENLENTVSIMEDYMVYTMIGNPSKMQTQMNAAIAKSTESLNKFEALCKDYLKAGDTIDQNIFTTIAGIKADRQKIASSNGYDTWALYQVHLEALEKAKHDQRVKDKATELAIVQKEYEEELKRLEEESRAEWLKNRIDFSKPLSQQNHNKAYYMEKALEDLKSDRFLSEFADISLIFESDAFDKLFRIRANGGNISLLQDLYDSHPNEFSLILALYYANN